MRSLVVSVLLSSVPALAAPRPVVAFLPPGSGDERLARLGLLMQARASELVEQTGRFSELHLKQVFAAAEAEGLSPTELDDPKEAARARAVLGADAVVLVTLEAPEADQIALTGQVLGAKVRAFSATLPSAAAQALAKGSDAIAQAVLASFGVPPAKKPPPQPRSDSDAAIDALAACYATAIRQSLGIESPAMVMGEELDQAAERCATAEGNDASLSYATATGALALALLGESEQAAQRLTALADADGVAEPLLLARFFMVSRFQSNADAVAFLKGYVAAHPGHLLALNYLADTLGVLGDHAAAASAWRDFIAAVPASPFGYGRLSRELARLGKHDEAIAMARKGLALVPASREAQLQLGSRYIDAGKLPEAIKALEQLGAIPDARAEALLRLGWAYWLAQKQEPAQKAFRRALELGTAPSEWRTRARAHYDLALVAAKAGKKDAARAELKAALEAGFRGTLDPLLDGLVSAPDAGVTPAVRETSAFPVNGQGDVDPTVKKPPAPAGYTPVGR